MTFARKRDARSTGRDLYLAGRIPPWRITKHGRRWKLEQWAGSCDSGQDMQAAANWQDVRP